MTLLDFFIGFTLVNGLPHFVLGTWKANMLSGFGFGAIQNKLYGLLNLLVSLSLFIYAYGFESILENGIFVGGLSIVLINILGGAILRDYCNRRMEGKE